MRSTPTTSSTRAGLVELLLDRCLDPEPFAAAPTDPAAAVSELLQVAVGVLASRQEVDASL